MTAEAPLRTDRLVLRRWRAEDRAPFAMMNSDPAVMEHFPSVLSAAESDMLADRIAAHFDRHGYGLWAVEVTDPSYPGDADFVGFVGLATVPFEAAFTPAVEVGWRLVRDAWGRGYASEAARAATEHGFGHGGLDEIVSFTTPVNERSQAVMRRIGMTRDPAGDFDHPRMPEGHPLRRHVLYRLRSPVGAA